MADYSFGGSDEENAELKKLNTEVVSFDASHNARIMRHLLTDF